MASHDVASIVSPALQHGETQGAYKTARFAFDKLAGLCVPAAWQAQMDLAALLMRSRQFKDADDLLPLCFRCSTTNPLVHKKGDVCISCGGRFVRSFTTFEHLPMVEFEVADGVQPAEAKKLILEDPPAKGGAGGGGGGGGRKKASRQANNEFDGFEEREMGGDVQTLMFEDSPSPGGGGAEEDVMFRMDDPFTQQMAVPNAPIVCTREMLRDLPPSEVVIKPSGCALVKPRYFRLMDSEAPVTVDEAGNFYETDEYELACLERGRTPFTRKAVTKAGLDPAAEAASAAEDATESLAAAGAAAGRGSWGGARAMQMARGLEMGGTKGYDPSRDSASQPRHSLNVER